jgi:hypothetical protein
MTISASRALAAAAGAVLLHFVTFGSALADDDHALRADQRASIGFEIAKTQNIALDPNVPSQGLGSYLVTVSSCNDCHSQPNFAPEGDPYSRQPKQVNLPTYLAGGRSFPVPAGTCSANLSPAPQTGLPAGLTRAQFIYVIRTGCDPQDENFNADMRPLAGDALAKLWHDAASIRAERDLRLSERPSTHRAG